jgi:GalNAc-alpha-(1->4)-GalNAc-alpha-(1->3)-diNAcBac-PP-undecaprenol alpha-1,4-N-acetyl-D-galactosaminyltransferase
LILVGDDHLKQKNRIKLEVLIKELGMEGRIELAGKRSDVESFYLRSRIFAFTSSSEGFPNAIGEAMSAGLPVVAYDCVAGPSEMIKDGVNGFLVPLHDMEIFAQRLKWLIEHPQEASQMGYAAKASIQRFSNEAIGEEFFKFITSTPIT